MLVAGRLFNEGCHRMTVCLKLEIQHVVFVFTNMCAVHSHIVSAPIWPPPLSKWQYCYCCVTEHFFYEWSTIVIVLCESEWHITAHLCVLRSRVLFNNPTAYVPTAIRGDWPRIALVIWVYCVLFCCVFFLCCFCLLLWVWTFCRRYQSVKPQIDEPSTCHRLCFVPPLPLRLLTPRHTPMLSCAGLRYSRLLHFSDTNLL